MSNEQIIIQRIRESIAIKQELLANRELLKVVSDLADNIVSCLFAGGKLVICGNGGSASDSLHFAGEIVGRFIKERKSWPAITLNSDIATLTSISNDYGYDDVFARQTEGLVRPSDMFIGISTSGNSENVYRACIKANELGATTACLVGHRGGKIADVTNFPIIIPNNITARIQECHILIIHILCEIVESKMIANEKK